MSLKFVNFLEVHDTKQLKFKLKNLSPIYNNNNNDTYIAQIRKVQQMR